VVMNEVQQTLLARSIEEASTCLHKRDKNRKQCGEVRQAKCLYFCVCGVQVEPGNIARC